MTPKVLVIDDDRGVRAMLRVGLRMHGFEVVTAGDGQEGLRQAYHAQPDMVILDITMDGMDGWTTCERLRQVTDVPVIMFSGRASQADIVKGLALGADDYVTKPCRLDELCARIHSHLRRSARRTAPRGKTIYDDGYLYVDLCAEIVRKGGALLALTPIEYRLLACLVHAQGRVVSHHELLIATWGPEYTKQANYLGVQICYLRRKVEDDPGHPRYIQTRRKVGYCFVAAIDQPERGDGPPSRLGVGELEPGQGV